MKFLNKIFQLILISVTKWKFNQSKRILFFDQTGWKNDELSNWLISLPKFMITMIKL